MVVLLVFVSVYLAVPIIVGLERPLVSMGSSQIGSTFGNIDCIWIVDSVDSVGVQQEYRMQLGCRFDRLSCVVSIAVGLVCLSAWVAVTLVVCCVISITVGLHVRPHVETTARAIGDSAYDRWTAIGVHFRIVHLVDGGLSYYSNLHHRWLIVEPASPVVDCYFVDH